MKPHTLLLIAGLVALGSQETQAQAAPPGWQFLQRSHEANFSIRCLRGNEEVLGVYSRPGTSDYQVARDVWIYTLPDGRVALSFMYGFVQANKQAVFVPSNDVRCFVSEA